MFRSCTVQAIFNAWDNPEFVAAAKKTGREKLIVAGVSTEVCVAFVALSAVKEGYDVYAVIDASGTWNKLERDHLKMVRSRHGECSLRIQLS